MIPPLPLSGTVCDVTRVMARRTAAPSPPVLLADDDALQSFVGKLRKQSCVALDTEAASFHRYVDRIYLLQLSSDSETAIIDPLSIKNLKPLGRLLADSSVEVVFHDADYDLRVLDRDYGFRGKRLFDTRIAAQLLGEPAIGLGPLLEKYFGVHVNKKYQRADWSQRPLTPEMISYAATDTAYLLSLRSELRRQLEAHDRLSWADEEFKRLESIRWSPHSANGNGFLRLKGAKSLPPKSLAVLRAVYEWREKRAARLDRAPFRILGNESLSVLARAAPKTEADLQGLSGLPAASVQRYGTELLKAVRAGLRTPAKDYPRSEKPPRPKMNRPAMERLDRLKALRRRRAQELGIEIGVLCPNATLQAIVRAAPTTATELRKIDDTKRWQIDAMGIPQIIELLNGKSDAAAKR